ncbi:hypothetical protein [Streptomyces capitiformicae]|uniref:Uncharacterized protein n=1 Tax=Streptomyces capitiformicae TaxID=2014920 RepID=A0A919GLT9_9ACTN|nr:hypothetical protein [Streptomyces capitiformicae]GHH87007.1 hypothetical protein GCM10017771_26440 [Streptomyces capitiformicae]
MQSGANYATALAFAAVALLAVMSVALFYLLVPAERLLLPWVRETTSQRRSGWAARVAVPAV